MSERTSSRGLGLVLAVTAGLLSSWLPSHVSAQGKEELVRIQDYPGIGNLLYRVAIRKGFCKKQGLECQLTSIPAAPLGAQALLANSIDVGLFPPSVQINAMVKGARLKAIGSGATRSILLIAARNDVPTPSAEKGYPALMWDLKGKKIGVPSRGTDAELQFVFLAQKAGMKAADFTFVAVGAPNTSHGALISRQVDASITYEPSGALCEVTEACKVIYRGATSPEPKEIFDTSGAASILVATQDTVQERARVIDALIAAGKEAEEFVQDPANFDEVLAISESYFKFDMPKGREVAIAALRSLLPGYKIGLNRPALAAVANFLLIMKQLDMPFDASLIPYEKAP